MTSAPIDSRPYERRARVLSRDEELEVIALAQTVVIDELSKAIRATARRQLMTAHTGHVWHMAHIFGRRSGEHTAGDFASAGIEGMEKAIDKFEPERGIRFLSYATHWIRAYMFRLITKRGHAKGVLLMSLETPTTTTRGGAEYTLGDNLASEEPDQEELVMRAADAHTAKTKLDVALQALPQRQRHIIQRRHLDEDAVNLAEIGREMSLSRERVRQLEFLALRRLRQALEEI